MRNDPGSLGHWDALAPAAPVTACPILCLLREAGYSIGAAAAPLLADRI